VEHYTTFLYKLLNTGKIKIDNKTHIKCTYHDSCYMGRYMDIYDEPREILKAFGELVEMKKIGLTVFVAEQVVEELLLRRR